MLSLLGKNIITLAFLLCSAAVLAADIVGQQSASTTTQLAGPAEIAALKQSANDMEAAAQATLSQETPPCYRTFLVNACLSKLAKSHRESMNKAATLRHRAKEMELAQASANYQRRDAERQKKDQDLQAARAAAVQKESGKKPAAASPRAETLRAPDKVIVPAISDAKSG